MRTTIRLAVLVAIVAATRGAGAQSIPVDAALRAFAEARVCSASDAGKLWGRPLAGPMFFVNPATRDVVANSADPQGELKGRDGVFVGRLPDDKGAANCAIDWLGQKWTMVMWPLPENKYIRARLLMHESFHRIQDAIGLPARNPANNHLDSAEGRTWLQMEWRALSEALIRSGDERRRAVADALLFRAHRRAATPGAADSERELEMNEGLAEYTGYKACGLPDAVLPDRVAIRLDQQQGGTGFVRNFAYASGPAYGLLLDAADPNWRTGLTPEHDLGEMLRRAMHLDTPADTPDALAAAAERYDGPALIRAEAERDQKRQRRLAEYKQRFFDSPVLLLPLSPNVNYTYDPNALTAYDDSASVYNAVRITDEWGILEVTAGGALLARTNGAMSSVRVPAPSDPRADSSKGDGWTLQPAPGWRLVPGARAGDFTLARQDK